MAYRSQWLCSVPVFSALVALGCGASSRHGDHASDGHGAGNTSAAGVGGGGTGGSAPSTGGMGGVAPNAAGAAPDAGGAAPDAGGAGGAPPSASGAGGATAGSAPMLDCTFEVRSPLAEASPPSTVETDLEITCNDSEFGGFGLRVGAGPDTTYLAATSSSMAWVGEVGAASFVRHSLPTPAFARKVLELALTPEGVPNVAIAGSGAVVLAMLESDGFFVTEPVIAYDAYGKTPIDLAVDDQGRAAMGIAHGGADGSYSWVTRLSEGNWQLDALLPARRSSWVRFALDQAGAPVSFWNEGGETSVGATGAQRVLDPTGARYVPVPYQAGGQGPLYAIVTQSDDAVSAIWPDGDTNVTWPLPNTARFASSCALPDSFTTPCMVSTCHDDAAGVVPSAFAVDRATDGGFFIAYVWRRRDRDVTFEPGECATETGCRCSLQVDRDASQDELHVVHLGEDGSVRGVLVLEIDEYREPLGDGTQMVERALDLDIQENALALGVLTVSGMRVVRVSLGDATH